MYYFDKDLETLKTSQYLFEFKDSTTKCGPKQKIEHTLSFQIPKDDPEMFDDKSVEFDNQQRALNRVLTGSVFGDLYQIYYSLKVFVKHVGVT